MKKKMVFFTGAGISKSSGISTYRDKDGIWSLHNSNEVAHIDAWNNTPEIVISFFNELRDNIINAKPNSAHYTLASLQDEYDVTIITQNIDNLHEQAGSSNVIHIHGELNKYYDIHTKPNVVLFGEEPLYMIDAIDAIYNCDMLIIIGTSLEISYTIPLLSSVKNKNNIYYIDPNPSDQVFFQIPTINFIRENAIPGLKHYLEIL